MLNKYNIYLDTSVPNFLFADDSPEKKEITIDFFDNFIKKGIYNPFISEVVIAEIEDTKDQKKRNKLIKVIEDYFIGILELTTEEAKASAYLAYQYIDKGVIPAKKEPDAFHIAISVIKKIDFLVSWNYKHLANVMKEKKIRTINLENNYTHDLRIITPLELIDYGS